MVPCHPQSKFFRRPGVGHIWIRCLRPTPLYVPRLPRESLSFLDNTVRYQLEVLNTRCERRRSGGPKIEITLALFMRATLGIF